MAVRKQQLTDKEIETVSFEFDNGDIEAVKNVMEKYNFKDEESLFRFALAVLLRAEKNRVFIDEKNAKVSLEPSEKVLKDGNETNV